MFGHLNIFKPLINDYLELNHGPGANSGTKLAKGSSEHREGAGAILVEQSCVGLFRSLERLRDLGLFLLRLNGGVKTMRGFAGVNVRW